VGWAGDPVRKFDRKDFCKRYNVFLGSSDDILPPFQIVEVEEGNRHLGDGIKDNTA
jgi:hypothetical protein